MWPIVLGLVVGCVPAAGPSLVVEGTDRPLLRGTVPAGVAAADGERWLTLRMVRADGGVGAPVFGRYVAADGELRFEPRHALAAGATFRATLVWPDGRRVERTHVVPAAEGEAPRVLSIAPGGAVLPANTLKFYVRFSRPMAEGQAAFDRVELLEDGEVVPEVWRPQELWSPDGTMLTLFVHPGRLKRGVGPRRALGPPMVEGRRYTVRVPASLEDVEGRVLAGSKSRTFVAGPEDRRCPLPQTWTMSSPAAGSREALVVEFGEGLDPLLAEECLTVSVAGTARVSADGRSWRFVPAAAWRAGEHVLRVDPTLEDLAGNRPGRRFEERPGAPARGGVLTRRFVVR